MKNLEKIVTELNSFFNLKKIEKEGNSISFSRKNLSKEELNELLFIFFTKHCYHCDEIMLFYYKDLLHFNSNDWLSLLKRLGIVAQKYPLGIISFLDFFYMYLELDLIREYAQMKDIDVDLQIDNLKDYYERPGKLCTTWLQINYEEKMTRFSISQQDLNVMHNKLVLEGILPAEPINPERHIVKGTSSIVVQGIPPSSWSWIGECFFQ